MGSIAMLEFNIIIYFIFIWLLWRPIPFYFLENLKTRLYSLVLLLRINIIIKLIINLKHVPR